MIRDDLDCVELVDPDQDALAGEIDRLQEFSSYLDELVAVLASLSESVSPVMRKLGGKLSGLGEECFERFPEYPDYGDDDSSAWSSGRSDEIDRIFTDL
ncbi:MAG: hypothetical protein FJW35_18050 [Acidobacteria bacterium]|nr:hypothetical protein [Acidobacteriota bacterium]